MKFIPLVISLMVIASLMVVCFEPFRVSAAFAGLRKLAFNERGLLFQRISRTGAEKIFVVVYNSWSTAAITVGQGVIWDFATDADGVGVTRPTARATNAGVAACGVVADASIAAGAYGLVQVYGYHAVVRVRTVTGGTPAIVPGRPLVINVAGSVWCLESVSTASTVILTYPMGFSLGSTAGFTTAARPAFIKAL